MANALTRGARRPADFMPSARVGEPAADPPFGAAWTRPPTMAVRAVGSSHVETASRTASVSRSAWSVRPSSASPTPRSRARRDLWRAANVRHQTTVEALATFRSRSLVEPRRRGSGHRSSRSDRPTPSGVGSLNPLDDHANRRALVGREWDSDVEEIASWTEILGQVVLGREHGKGRHWRRGPIGAAP
jgi:hypothetical protein